MELTFGTRAANKKCPTNIAAYRAPFPANCPEGAASGSFSRPTEVRRKLTVRVYGFRCDLSLSPDNKTPSSWAKRAP